MNHKEKLIEHLSSEIITLSSSSITLRTKLSMSLMIGPFLILGSLLVATKEKLNAPEISTELILEIILLFILYLGVGFLAGTLDNHQTKTANKMRKTIHKIIKDEEIEEGDIVTNSRKIPQIYLGFYAVLFSSLLIITRIVFLIVEKS